MTVGEEPVEEIDGDGNVLGIDALTDWRADRAVCPDGVAIVLSLLPVAEDGR